MDRPLPINDDHCNQVVDEVFYERGRQDAKWGLQSHDMVFYPEDDHAYYRILADNWKLANSERVAYLNSQGAPSDRNCYWDGILLEEVFEALAEIDPQKQREELVQVAAVAVAMIECIDRRDVE